jgi:hypothetical protein
VKELVRNWRVEVIQKEVVLACCKAIFLNSPGGIEKDHKK